MAIARRWSSSAARAATLRLVRGHAYRLLALLELGDIAGVDRELASTRARRGAADAGPHLADPRAPGDARGARRRPASRRGPCRAVAPRGRARRAAARPAVLRRAARPDPQPPGPRGRAAPAGPGAGRALPRHSRLAQRPDQPRRARAGEIEQGRVELERSPGTTSRWSRATRTGWPAIALLARGGGAAGRRERSGLLYEELLPYAGLVIVVARAAGSNGPVDRILGLLAEDARPARRGRRGTWSARSRSRPGWATGPPPRSRRVDLAEVLLARDGRGDRERALELLARRSRPRREMGARWIAERALALRLEAQGLAGVDVDHLDRRRGRRARDRAARPARPRRPRRHRRDPLQRHRGLDDHHRAARRRALARGPARAQRGLPRADRARTRATR